MVLLGNKADMNCVRSVKTTEGAKLARVLHNTSDTCILINGLLEVINRLTVCLFHAHIN